MSYIYKTTNTFTLLSVTNNITAHAGGGQALATQLTTEFSLVTNVANTNDSVKLFTPIPGLRVTVLTYDLTTFNDIRVYAPSGVYLDNVLNGYATLYFGVGVDFTASDATHWFASYG
jgi:hypothetical protein